MSQTLSQLCDECGQPTLHIYRLHNRILCGDCKWWILAPETKNELLDNPRRGQAAGLNALIRKPE